MKVFTILTLASAASAISVSYDTGYDNGARSLTAVSCSDGPNGLITKYGWTTQAQIPGYIGGADVVTGWNSPSCGTCWQLTYGEIAIHVLAVDYTANGFNIQLDAMNALTNGQAVMLGRIEATATQVDLSSCGV